MTNDEATSTSDRLVLAVVRNLMDGVPITEAARRLGIRVAVAPPEQAIEACRRERPECVVLDLAAPGVIALLADPILSGIRTIGFYPHVQPDLREQAMREGLGRAVPRSAFFGRLPEMLSAASDETRLPGAGGGC